MPQTSFLCAISIRLGPGLGAGAGAGATETKQVFRLCVLVTTVGEVARKVMGDAPVAYIEGVGGTRVSEDDVVAVGKNDV